MYYDQYCSEHLKTHSWANEIDSTDVCTLLICCMMPTGYFLSVCLNMNRPRIYSYVVLLIHRRQRASSSKWDYSAELRVAARTASQPSMLSCSLSLMISRHA